jgi:hypothetical protein
LFVPRIPGKTREIPGKINAGNYLPFISGDVISCDATSGDVTSGDVISGDATSGDVTSGDVISGDATSGDVISGDSTSGDVISGDSTSGDVTAPHCSPSNTKWMVLLYYSCVMMYQYSRRL